MGDTKNLVKTQQEMMADDTNTKREDNCMLLVSKGDEVNKFFASSLGRYEKVLGMTLEYKPVWKHETNERYLVMNLDRWVVTGTPHKPTDGGFIKYQDKTPGANRPDQLPKGKWMYFKRENGNKIWYSDTSFNIYSSFD